MTLAALVALLSLIVLPLACWRAYELGHRRGELLGIRRLRLGRYLRPSRVVSPEAAAWVCRLKDDGCDERAHADFLAWLQRSPRRLEEIFAASILWRRMREMYPDREVTPPEMLALTRWRQRAGRLRA